MSYRVTASKNVSIGFGLVSFPGNCGYRIMNHDLVHSGYSRLTRSEQRYLNRFIYYKLCTDNLKSIRKVILTEKMSRDHWLYDFIVDNDLLIGTPVTGAHGGHIKTISAEFDPFNSNEIPAPRRPSGYKKVANGFVDNIQVKQQRTY